MNKEEDQYSNYMISLLYLINIIIEIDTLIF